MSTGTEVLDHQIAVRLFEQDNALGIDSLGMEFTNYLQGAQRFISQVQSKDGNIGASSRNFLETAVGT